MKGSAGSEVQAWGTHSHSHPWPTAILSPEAATEDHIRIFSQATWWQAGKLTREEGLC